VVAEVLCVVDDAAEHVFFFGLEREGLDLALPLDQVLELWSCCISRDLDAPVADGTRVFLVFFNFATSDLETFSVIPVNCQLELLGQEN
jgi:hypothetical protein